MGFVANSQLSMSNVTLHTRNFNSEKFMIDFKGRHFEKEIILQSVRWYLAYALSYRDIEELMTERDFFVDHSTINR